MSEELIKGTIPGLTLIVTRLKLCQLLFCVQSGSTGQLKEMGYNFNHKFLLLSVSSLCVSVVLLLPKA